MSHSEDSFHTYSSLLNTNAEDEALAIEQAIRAAINTVSNLILRTNNRKQQEYERMVADRDREIKRLECKLEKSESEIKMLRLEIQSRMAEDEESGRCSLNKQRKTDPDQQHKASAQRVHGGVGMTTPPQTSTSHKAFPHQPLSTRRHSEDAEEETGRPALRWDASVVKEEPADLQMDIKWEMCELRERQPQESAQSSQQQPGGKDVSGRVDADSGCLSNEETTPLSFSDLSWKDVRMLHPFAQSKPPGASLRKAKNLWINRLEIPWDKFPTSLTQAMSRGVRANPSDRRQMVRAVVHAMQEHTPNPSRAACVEVARMIVSQYPLTFADTTEEGGQSGICHYSLANQFKTRIENVNRNNSGDRIRKPKTVIEGGDGGVAAKTARSQVDSYGCINWQPQVLPDGETFDTLENRRKDMLATFQSAGPRAGDTSQVDESMRLTYIYQRHMINRFPPPSISDVQEQWPFLFTRRGLCAHFKTLTGIDISQRLGDALHTEGRRIIQFFQRQTHNADIQTLLQGLETEDATSRLNQSNITTVLLLMKHFLEKEDSMFILADPSATSASIQKDMTLPATPRLIMLGDTFLSATKWMVSIEGKVAYVLDEGLNFADCLSVFFGCFYVFNLEYQEPACATLEFIQRFFVRINPEEDTKCHLMCRVFV
ncbi:uncharacterized protein LOC115435407 isoform X2 [Sphaeramia orbicularis]|uniref:uncharacterized protein LOC115435407 isoform X2 n=1 Tax=Sphaeramia orbicularis TaxID=375764 RepID=UPI00117E7CAA|nr:uncharacterized protein LOC115435407 isoform X2 [Sphaeramia orbicularis]